jgi:hypothetical protein
MIGGNISALMSNSRNHRRRFHWRALSVESLEPRAVPAGLVQQFELPPDVVSSAYSSAVVARDEILVSGTARDKPIIIEFNDAGEVIGRIALGLPDGRDAGNVVAISDNGKWALGLCHLAGSWDIPEQTVIWNLQDAAHPQVVDALTGAHDLLPSSLGEHASITDDGSFVFNSFTLGINLVHSNGVVERVPQPFDATPNSPSDQQVRAISRDGRIMIGIDAPGNVLIWHDLSPSDLSIPAGSLGGDAESISADGRVVGGTIADYGSGGIGAYPQAAVWVDGSLRILRDAAGNQLDGTVDYILPQSGGEDHGWIVIGRTYGLPGFEGRYIAFTDSTFSEYTLVPLHEFISQQSGTDDSVTLSQVLNVELRGNSLYVFSAYSKPVTVPIGGGGACVDDPSLLSTDRPVPDGAVLDPIRRCVRVLSDEAMPSHVDPSFFGTVYIVPLPLPLDVDGDGQIAPSDVLLVINALNSKLAAGVDDSSLAWGSYYARLDVSRDGHLTAVDALVIINNINGAADSVATTPLLTPLAAEGEFSISSDDPTLSILVADQILNDLATPRRK